MEYAINSQSGRKVWASDPWTIKGSYYICPNCSAPVTLRKGSKISAYFAHKSNQAKVSCELYMASDNDGVPNFGQTIEREALYRTLGLYVRLIDEQSSPIKWSLEIGIPEPDVGTGIISMPFAWGGKRDIPVASIKSGGLRVRIPPRIGPFNIVHNNVPEGRWRGRISSPIAGLDSKCMNVFRYSPFGGRLLNGERPLYWGRAYVLLWTASCSPSWWPPGNVMQTAQLKGEEAWTGGYIQLPAFPDARVVEWIQAHIGASVEHPLAEVELVAPLPEYRLPDGSYVIKNGEKAVIGIKGELGVKKWRQVLYQNSSMREAQKISGKGLVPSVLQLQLLNGRNSIWLDDEVEEGLQIMVDPTAVYSFSSPEVQLLAYDELRGDKYKLPLHSQAIEELLKRACKGEVTFAEIYAPDGVNVSVEWRELGGREQSLSRFTKDSPEGNPSFSQYVLQLLNSLREGKVSYLCIDAGAFGRGIVQLLGNSTETPIRLIDMGENWRRKARYILGLSKRGASSAIFASYRRIDASKFCKKDQQVMYMLASQIKWPVELASSCLELFNECERVYKRHCKKA